MKQPDNDDELTRCLEEKLGYRFRDRALLQRALTHRSWAYEKFSGLPEAGIRLAHNEPLEWLGDSVLGLVITEALFHRFAGISEGELSTMRRHLVSSPTLADAASGLGLGRHLRLGVGEEKTGGRKKRNLLTDVFESVLGAIYLDGGYEGAAAFVRSVLAAELASVSPQSAAARDFKSILQERLRAERNTSPVYHLLRSEGPPHRRRFFVEVTWEDKRVPGEGSSIKRAEFVAARRALAELDAKQG